ncbi:MAG TPA: M3 family oligoendopeptidase [Fimbriimonas sp.]
MAASATLPRWDMDVVYPGLASPEFRAAFDRILEDIGRIEQDFDSRGIDKGGPGNASTLDPTLNEVNAFLDRFETLYSYVACIVSTDTRDEAALAAESELDQPLSRVRKLLKRLTAWVGGLDLKKALAESETAKEHRYFLERARIATAHLMDPELESLVSDLEITGSSAWDKLYGKITSQLPVTLEYRGKTETLPMSAIRALASDPDRGKRKAAYDAELAAWKSVEVPIASCLNGIKGETLTVTRRRQWSSPLEAACFNASIDLPTLDAMMLAARESFPMFRRYLQAKARAIGVDRLAFYDLFAPIAKETKPWSREEAESFVVDQFATYSPKLSEFAARSYRESWIDWEPRDGKVDGAYCAPLRMDESRILMNFKGTYDSVRTLAHELGHGYHNLCLKDRVPLLKDTPMTLAETASIFCETIVKNGVLQTGTDEEKLVALEGALTGACQVVVDISSRFLFEQSVFELRSKREANPREFCELMLKAQKETYGDGLDEAQLHPYMWAAKGHYYGSSYYNFPYMFGLLFGLGLYTVYQNEGEAFKARYDDLLGSTGTADATTLGSRFGIDIRTPDFWRGSLAQIGADFERFESLI